MLRIITIIIRGVPKVILGFFMVLVGMVLDAYWKWWEGTTGKKKFLFGLFFVPAAGFLLVASPIWEKL